jgi:hypothetical protein
MLMSNSTLKQADFGIQTAKHVAEVPAGIESVSNEISHLNEQISDLFGRLGPVLRYPVPEDAAKCGSVEAAPQTEIGAALSDLRRRISNINVDLSDALRRLEL